MEQLEQLLEQILTSSLVQIVISNPVRQGTLTKIKIRPVLLKEELFFQETIYQGTQVFHKNAAAQELKEHIMDYLNGQFKQAQIQTASLEATVLSSKKGKITVKTRYIKKMFDKEENHAISRERSQEELLAHNRVKKYLLEDGKPVAFLIKLGVQTPEGKVIKAKYDKFRQINRYLEFIDNVLEELPKDRPVQIIDFGCGKSYLTFAMYYYLHEIKHYPLQIIGLDLKEDVIRNCNQLAEEFGYKGLIFQQGDISTYEDTDKVDMVVSLHACDTATDYALEKAVKWGAKVIMAVPCCQHEVNRQIHCDEWKPILKYGFIKERMSALITDAVRANLLEQQGYDTQILEFIDMEHTPKNLLIRAVKRQRMKTNNQGNIQDIMDYLHIHPKFAELLSIDTEYK